MFVDYLSTLLVFTACDHVVSLVLTCLDYGNGMLAGVASNQLDRLQSMMNVTSRLVCSAGKSDHITPLLRILHWLRVPQRIEFKLAVLVFHCLYGMAPPYLVRELCCVADMDCHHRLHSTSTLELHWLDVPDWVLFKLAVTVHQCLNGLAPPYLSEHCIPVFSADTRRHLCSANRHLLGDLPYRVSGSALTAVGRFQLLGWPDGLKLTPGFYPGSNEQHRLF